MEALLWAAAICYGVSGALYMAHLARAREGLTLWGGRLLTVGVLLHAVSLAWRLVALALPPAMSGMEGLSLLGLLVASGFLMVARKYKVESMGAFAAPLASTALVSALLFAPEHPTLPPALRTAYFVVHITVAFLGNALMAMAAVAAGSYIIQERNLRLKKLMQSGVRLPNLNLTDHLAYRTVTLGFLFMSLGIVSGIIYSKHAWHAYWSWDPRQTWSLCTWLAYAALLHARLTVGWRGRRWALLTVAAFGLVVTASVVLDVFKLGKHSGTYDSRPAETQGERP